MKLSALNISKKEHEIFQNFKSQFNRKYSNDEEETKKLLTFTKNLRKIDSHNEKFKRGESTYEMGINEFADIDDDEFKATHTGYIPDLETSYTTKNEKSFNDPIKTVDPNKFNLNNFKRTVRNQENCSGD